MKTHGRTALGLLIASALALGSCSTGETSDTGLIAPVTVDITELPGSTYELRVGQFLNINTGDAAGEDYTGSVQDSTVAEFVPARTDDTAEYNPGVAALREGQTSVEITGPNLEDEPAAFTVKVVN